MWGFGVGAALKADLRMWRGQRSCGPARGWKRKRSGLRGGMRGDGHEVSILIRLGDGDRPGRASSNDAPDLPGWRSPRPHLPSKPLHVSAHSHKTGFLGPHDFAVERPTMNFSPGVGELGKHIVV